MSESYTHPEDELANLKQNPFELNKVIRQNAQNEIDRIDREALEMEVLFNHLTEIATETLAEVQNRLAEMDDTDPRRTGLEEDLQDTLTELDVQDERLRVWREVADKTIFAMEAVIFEQERRLAAIQHPADGIVYGTSAEYINTKNEDQDNEATS